MPREIYKTKEEIEDKYGKLFYNSTHDVFLTKEGVVVSAFRANRTGNLYGFIVHSKSTHKKDKYIFVKANKKSIYLHRLIAETFIPNPDNLPVVDHINRDRQDNRIENLRWASLETNAKNSERFHNAEIQVTSRKDWTNEYHKRHRITINKKQYYLPSHIIEHLRAIPKSQRLQELNKIRQA